MPIFKQLFITFCFTIASISSADVALAEKVNTVYCPTIIECPAAGNVSLCHPDIPMKNYIQSIDSINGVDLGEYSFTGVDANYHYQFTHVPFVSSAVCHYQKGIKFIDVNFKKSANIEVFYDNSTKWDVSGTNKLYVPDAFCKSSSTKECPLITKPEIVFDLQNNSVDTVAGENNIHLKELTQPSSLKFLTINNDEALAVCGSVDRCEIKVWTFEYMGTNKFRVSHSSGSVFVNVNDRMLIVDIKRPTPSIQCGNDGVCSNTNYDHLEIDAPGALRFANRNNNNLQ